MADGGGGVDVGFDGRVERDFFNTEGEGSAATGAGAGAATGAAAGAWGGGGEGSALSV